MDERVAALRAQADALCDAGDFVAARAAYDQVLAIAPADLLAIYNSGFCALRLGAAAEARRCFERVAAAYPMVIQAWTGLAEALQQQRAFAAAEAAARRALALQPGHVPAWLGLGNALKGLGRNGAAVDAYRRAGAMDTGNFDARFNLGVALADQMASQEAAAAFEAALALRPDHAEARLSLAFEYLRQGDFERGWCRHEARLARGIVPARSEPLWDGHPGPGTLLLFGEQGLGDVLQFVRYARSAAARGWRIVVEAPAPLVRLLADGADGVDAAYALRAAPGPVDAWRPLMSLPLVFGTSLTTVPTDLPYLRVPDPVRRSWHDAVPPVGPAAAMTVGLVWAGAPRPEVRPHNDMDRRRSIPLPALSPVLTVPGVHFVSLQHGAARGELADPAVAGRLLDPMDGVADFADTAALVEQVDLVISVDTAVVHLAGGLGKPVWVLSRFDACWRWLEHAETSPWYPQARVFHQPRPGDWASVITRVAEALQREVTSLRRSP